MLYLKLCIICIVFKTMASLDLNYKNQGASFFCG
jgi:hypothetical protein